MDCRHPVKVVPILVGALNTDNEAMYGRLLAKYVDDPTNFFSVSSDFCHWGSRYVSLYAGLHGTFLLLNVFVFIEEV
jgi:predicted class III extradiol MEMO1 family dioxygenase